MRLSDRFRLYCKSTQTKLPEMGLDRLGVYKHLIGKYGKQAVLRWANRLGQCMDHIKSEP